MLFVFDMGGVVASSSCTVSICARFGISLHDFYSFQLDSEGRNTYQDLSVGSINVENYWENFSRNSNIEIQEDFFKSLYNPEVDKSALLLIKELKKRGYRVVCGTNTIESHFEVHWRRGNYAVFDCVYSSHLIGVKKPSPEFFNRIIEVERVLAERVYFVDDDKRNIEGGRAVGINTHLFVSVEHLQNALAMFLM